MWYDKLIQRKFKNMQIIRDGKLIKEIAKLLKLNAKNFIVISIGEGYYHIIKASDNVKENSFVVKMPEGKKYSVFSGIHFINEEVLKLIKFDVLPEGITELK